MAILTEYTGGSDDIYGWGSDSAMLWYANGFKISEDASVTSTTTYVTKTGSPTCDTYAEIRTDDGTGKPSATILATSNTINAVDIITGWVEYTFASPPTLDADVQYHVCFRAGTTDASNKLGLSGYADTPDQYTDGILSRRNLDTDDWLQPGATWDMKFQVLGTVAETGNFFQLF